jgi:hypothetical protein
MSDMSTNPTAMVGLQLPNLWLLKIMLRCVNDGVMTIKPEHHTTGFILHAVASTRKCLYLENTQGRLHSRMPGSKSEI